jgi:hypothetical protein
VLVAASHYYTPSSSDYSSSNLAIGAMHYNNIIGIDSDILTVARYVATKMLHLASSEYCS